MTAREVMRAYSAQYRDGEAGKIRGWFRVGYGIPVRLIIGFTLRRQTRKLSGSMDAIRPLLAGLAYLISLGRPNRVRNVWPSDETPKPAAISG